MEISVENFDVDIGAYRVNGGLTVFFVSVSWLLESPSPPLEYYNNDNVFNQEIRANLIINKLRG